jgi:ribonucleoside-diphosphate reductase alpha chain
MANKYRNIGVGILGYADLLVELDLPYGSDEALNLAANIERERRSYAEVYSEVLAIERGSPWGGARRNLILLTVAPTGSTSQIAGVEGSGIEPFFSPETWRKDHVHPEGTFVPSKYAAKGAARFALAKWNDGTSKKDLEVTWEQHVRTQAAFQLHSDSGISKTINMPNEATEKDVADAFMLAYDLKCKGITVYRDNSRKVQVLNVEKKEGTFDPQAALKAITVDAVGEFAKAVEKAVYTTIKNEPARAIPRDRPTVLNGVTRKLNTGYGTLYVTVNYDDNGQPFEVFATIGKAGGFTNSFTEAVARLISLGLRSGIPIQEVVDQLEGIRAPRAGFGPGGAVYSVPDGIAKALKANDGYRVGWSNIKLDDSNTSVADMTVTYSSDSDDSAKALVKRGDSPECPECGAELALIEGCVKCSSGCGYAECG